MSLAEIQQQLAQLEQDRQVALQLLAQRQQQGKYDLAQTIKELIAQHGWTPADIEPLLTSQPRRRGPGRKTSAAPVTPPAAATGTAYVDPQNPQNVYYRGPLPAWLKERMVEQGYDPSDKEARKAFKAQVLHQVAS